MNPIKSIREQRGVSQAWLAHQLDIHRATLHNYEAGITEPPVSIYYQLAHIFHMQVDEVMPQATSV